MEEATIFKRLMAFIIILILIFAVVTGTVFGYKKLGMGNVSLLNGLGKIIGINSEKNERINGLILGTDEGDYRTDFIMFVSYNPTNKKINMISIPRDTRVPNSPDKKINSLYSKGKEQLIIKDVENILGMPIKYYATISFKGLRKVVDDIGGIPMNVPIDMKYSDPYQKLDIDINKGNQILNGVKAEGFVRYRKGYPDGDLGRIKAQHEFINAAIAQVVKPQNITKIPSLVNTFNENVKTNMSIKELLTYAKQATEIDRNSITIENLPGEPDYIDGLSYFIYDKNKTIEMIQNNFTNEEDIDDKTVIERNKNFKVEVLNGTGVPGLGGKIAEILKEKGFIVTNVDNYEDTNVKNTKIFERTRTVEGAYVKAALKYGEVQSDYDESGLDITVILGQDANK